MRPFLSALLLAGAFCAASACARSEPGQASPHLPHIPVYPGAQLLQSVIRPHQDPTEYYLVADASQDEVLDWYRRRMSEEGWSASTDPDEDFVIYHTAEGCYAFVAAFANPDGTVELQLSQQDPDTPCYPYVTSEPGDD